MYFLPLLNLKKESLITEDVKVMMETEQKSLKIMNYQAHYPVKNIKNDYNKLSIYVKRKNTKVNDEKFLSRYGGK
jgi:hypothetical protein